MHLSHVLKHFWNRWKKENLLEVREFHQSYKKHGSTYIVQRGDIVTVYDEGHLRGLWRLAEDTGKTVWKYGDEMCRITDRSFLYFITFWDH